MILNLFLKISRRSIYQHRRLNHAHALKEDVKKTVIEKVLIANRGEIACRVIKTARRLGIRTVAVYSDADKRSLHVEMADEAYHIGPAPSSQSYLDANKILNVAKISGSQAVHPGYGFLSENLEFAELCKESGVIFVGPPSSAIRDMGIKSTSKHIMSNAGVPIIRGYHGEEQSIQRLKAEAKKIGFPLMIKAVRGGGGKGMRIAMSESEFEEALESAKGESMKSFGDQNVLLEQYITDPRHVEVQVFADMHGNAVHLFERDCSVQRRHQKVIEEAPAPGLSTETRSELGEAAVRAARAVGYVGAGTVEFILDRKTHSFHFMEMNTRLQVEHPITEMITGVDLVEWQLAIASGEPLPLRQEDLKVRGHAVESRVYAESPREGFLPRAGRLHYLMPPQESKNVRVETGVRSGDEVSVHYDPMIAKLVVWAPDRTSAMRCMYDNLSKYQIAGLDTNVEFLMTLCKNKAFLNGDVHTAFIPEHEKELFPPLELKKEKAVQAALAYILKEQSQSRTHRVTNGIEIEPSAFRPNYNHSRVVKLKYGDKEVATDVQFTSEPNEYLVKVDADEPIKVTATLRNGKLTATMSGHTISVSVVMLDDQIHLFALDGHTSIEIINTNRLRREEASSDGNVSLAALCPMPGLLQRVSVTAGQRVEAGEALYVVIAMKMEYTVRTPAAAVVKAVGSYKEGDAVPRNARIVELEPIDVEK